MLNGFMLAAFGGVVLFIAYQLVSQYRAATGTTWERLLAAGKGSATILWQKIGLLASFLIAAIDQGLDVVATLINDPDFATQAKSAVTAYLTPTNVTLGMAAFMAITIWARTRKKA